MKTNLLKYFVAGLALVASPLNSPNKVDIGKEFTNRNSIEEKVEPRNIVLKNPFEKISDDYYSELSTPAVIFLKNTLEKALDKHENEKLVQEKHKEFLDEVWRNKIYPEEKSDSLNQDYEGKMHDFYKEVGYYGRFLAWKSKPSYDGNKHKLFDSLGLKRTDCITYLLESMDEGNENFNIKSSYTNLPGFEKMLRKYGFESIYIAENTVSRDSAYLYNNGKFLTNDVIKNIKNKNYFMPIDYVVKDGSFDYISFKKFINETSGFLSIQDARHMGFLHEGDLLHAKAGSSLLGDVFKKESFRSKFDNHDPEHNFQSCVLFVPKGTVYNFLNKYNIEKNSLNECQKTFKY